MTTPAGEQLVLHSHTRGRRHPMMIGLRVVGVRVALLASPTQILVFVATAVPLWLTYSLWAHLGGVGNALVMAGLPLGAAFAARALRVEGRSPMRAAAGVLALMLSPAAGRRGGRASSRSRPRRRTVTYYLDPGPPRDPSPAPQAAAAEAQVAAVAVETAPATAPTVSTRKPPRIPEPAASPPRPAAPVRAPRAVPISELAAAARALQAGAFRRSAELEEVAAR